MNKIKNNINPKLLLILFILTNILIFLILCPTVYAQNKRAAPKTVKIAYNIQKNITDFDENGNYSGYTYEYLNKIAQFTGWKYEFVEINGKDTSDAITIAIDKVAGGELDLIGTLLKNEELEQIYQYPEKNYGAVYNTLLVPEDETSLNETNYMIYDPLRIAVLKTANTRNGELKRFLETAGIKHEFVYCNDDEQQYLAIKTKLADAMLSVSLSPVEGTKQLVKFSPRPFYFATTLGNTEISDAIDAAIEKINKTDPYFESRLYDKYFGNLKGEVALTEDEKDYIENNKQLNVLVLPNFAPFAFLDKEGEVSGISRSILDAIGEEANFHIDYTVLEEPKNIAEELHSGKYDVVFGMNDDETFAKQHGLVLSQRYVDIGMSYFTNNKKPLERPQEDCVLAISYDSEILPTVKYKELHRYPTLEECIIAVNNGKADFGYGNSYSTDFYIMQNDFSNIQIIPITGEFRHVSFAVVDTDNIELLKIINKQLTTITNKHIDSYLLQEISEIDKWTINKFIKTNRAFTITTVVVLVIAILSALFFAKLSDANKKKNYQLEQAYAQAESANNAKTEFLARMSHEMRTPISAVIGMTGIARDDVSDMCIVQDSLDKITVASNHLLSLINDILDMSKINEGKLKLQKSPFDFKQMVSLVEIVYGEYAKEKGIKMYFSIDENISVNVLGDELRIRQIIINLLSNAIKYNVENGKVDFSAELLEEKDCIQNIRISVSDTGVGISRDRSVDIFREFERETFADKAGIDGTGLGLTISQKIAGLMDSKIYVNSEQNIGSTFYFDLKLEKAEDLAKILRNSLGVEPVSLEGKAFLVVDDNTVNVLILEKMLTKMGATVEQAYNGQEAIEKFTQSEIGHYTAVFMDIRMPVLGGYEATKYIRELDRPDAKTLCIVAVSANAFLEDMEKSIACGMNDHLAKPIQPDKLYRFLDKIL